jgi:hypothetical protein
MLICHHIVSTELHKPSQGIKGCCLFFTKCVAEAPFSWKSLSIIPHSRDYGWCASQKDLFFTGTGINY